MNITPFPLFYDQYVRFYDNSDKTGTGMAACDQAKKTALRKKEGSLFGLFA